MKKYISSLILILTLALLFVVTLYSFFDTTTVSEKENRQLATKPAFTLSSWKNGEFQEQANAFLSDHVYGRTQLIHFANQLEDKFRLPGKILILNDVQNDNQTNATDSEYLILDDRILSLYDHNDTNFLSYFDSSNKLFQAIPNDVRKFFAICPSRIEYETDDIKQHSDLAKSDIDIIYENMPSDVTTIPVFSAIENATQSYALNDLYYRTDHHWSILGSFYGANAFLSAAGKEPVSLDDYNLIQGGTFQGFLTSINNKGDQIEPDALYYYQRKDGINPSETIYQQDKATGKLMVSEEALVDPARTGYYTFVGPTVFAYTEIDGLATDGSCLLMVADSYGLSLSTWLVDAYDTIIIVDPRYYDTIDKPFSELFQEYPVSDFLFCTEEDEMRASTFNNKMLESLLNIKE